MKKISWHELKPQVKEVWVLSLPAILTQITTIVMQYIDSAMVGSLGANASAAIGLRYIMNIPGIISPAPVRLRGKIWTVRLQYDPLQRNFCCDLL